MKFKIFYKDDSLVIDGETIDEIREKAYVECEKRNWNVDYCYSVELEE